MKTKRLIGIALAVMLLTTVSIAQDRATGSIKGKVKVESGTPAGVTVLILQGEREITRVATDKSGAFQIQKLPPGVYALKFRKPGLSVGTIENVEVKGGKTRSLRDGLILTIDEGSIAFIRGSVFNHESRSFAGARVELAKIQEDGSAKKIDGRVSNETGSFVFRLMPEPGKYRITAKAGGVGPVTKDIEIDGPAVYRVALTIPAVPK